MLKSLIERHPWIFYVVPFAAFMAMLVIGPALPVPPRVEAIIRVAVLIAVIVLVARPVLHVSVDPATRRDWARGFGLRALDPA
ncbi:MAG: hypothetical protein EXR94_08560 [Gemmatimonadetes bacterium]|nr:hypothetical protein [Gemmatimonadota bacterium]